MTLKKFAEQNGINYQTAKTWLRRGRIVANGDGFKVVALRDGEAVEVLVKPGESLKPYMDALKPDTFEPGVSGFRVIGETVTANTFDQAVLALSDRITKLEDQCECRDLEDECQWQTIKRLEGEIAELRAALATTNNSLIDSNNVLLALQTEVAFLRSRIADQPPPAATRTVSRGGPIDPPGPQWGA